MFNADATHCKGGTLYRLTSFDANGHVVPVLQKWSVHNESKEAWKQIAQSARLLYERTPEGFPRKNGQGGILKLSL